MKRIGTRGGYHGERERVERGGGRRIKRKEEGRGGKVGKDKVMVEVR